MESIIIEVTYTGNNYSAYIPVLPGVATTGDNIDEVEKNIREIVPFHLQGQRESGGIIPEEFNNEYELVFKLSVEAFLNAYSDVFTKAALSRITGINERQLWHYAAGVRKPRAEQRKRIENGIRQLAEKLLAVQL